MTNADMANRIRELEGQRSQLTEDAAEDHTHLVACCLNSGIDAAKVEGDGYGVPGIGDLADMLADRVRELESKLAACRPSDEAVAVAMLAVKLWSEADQYIRSRMMPKTMKRLADEIIRLAVEGAK